MHIVKVVIGCHGDVGLPVFNKIILIINNSYKKNYILFMCPTTDS